MILVFQFSSLLRGTVLRWMGFSCKYRQSASCEAKKLRPFVYGYSAGLLTNHHEKVAEYLSVRPGLTKES